MEFVDLNAQFRSIENNIHARMNNVFSHGKYVMGR